jgi:DNA polymerase-3 subunit delta
MNLRGRDAARFLARPPKDAAGALLHGADAMRVALKRQDLVAALAGPEAEAEMRLARLSGAEAKSDPAAVADALRAQGFFPGPRVVLVDGVTEAQAGPVLAALGTRAKGDAALVVTAGALRKTSKLRRAFEAHPEAASIALYDDPPDAAEITALVEAEGLSLTEEGRRDLDALALALEPGDLRQTVRKVALYAGGEAAGPEAVAAMAPATVEAGLDAVIHAAMEGEAAEIGPLMRRLGGQGTAAVQLAILTARHLRQLHALAAGGPAPRLFGPRADAMRRQARAWGPRRLERGLALMMETDLALRSASKAPALALLERALLRLAMLARTRD